MPIGRPLSPVSVAGVARRSDRRDGPGDNDKNRPVAKAAVVTSGAGPVVKMAAIRR